MSIGKSPKWGEHGPGAAQDKWMQGQHHQQYEHAEHEHEYEYEHEHEHEYEEHWTLNGATEDKWMQGHH